MKILKEGKLPEEQEVDFICSHCKCEFVTLAKECVMKSCWKDGTWYEHACPTEGCNMTCFGYPK
jgi:hypothetical protein